MINQFQQSYFEARYQCTLLGYLAPNFEVFTNAYSIYTKTITKSNQISKALNWFWHDEIKPQLLQVMIEPLTNTYSKIAFGKPLTEMEPFSKPIGIEST